MPSAFIGWLDMPVNSRDGDQDLSMWMQGIEELVREIMCDDSTDECFKGHQISALPVKRIWRTTAIKLGAEPALPCT